MDRPTSTTSRLFWPAVGLVTAVLMVEAWFSIRLGRTNWMAVTSLLGSLFVMVGASGRVPKAWLQWLLVTLGGGMLAVFLVLRVSATA